MTGANLDQTGAVLLPLLSTALHCQLRIFISILLLLLFIRLHRVLNKANVRVHPLGEDVEADKGILDALLHFCQVHPDGVHEPLVPGNGGKVLFLADVLIREADDALLQLAVVQINLHGQLGELRLEVANLLFGDDAARTAHSLQQADGAADDAEVGEHCLCGKLILVLGFQLFTAAQAPAFRKAAAVVGHRSVAGGAAQGKVVGRLAEAQTAGAADVEVLVDQRLTLEEGNVVQVEERNADGLVLGHRSKYMKIII